MSVTIVNLATECQSPQHTTQETHMAKSPATPSTTMPDFVQGDRKAALAAAGPADKVPAVMLPVESLHAMPGFNVRPPDDPKYQTIIADLKRSIESGGFLPNKVLSCFVGKAPDGTDTIYIRDGHMRYLAVSELNAEAVAAGQQPPVPRLPVVMLDSKLTMADHTRALIRENSGAALSMTGQSVLVRRLLKADKSYAEDHARLAKDLGITPPALADLVYLMNTPTEIRTLVRQGRISETVAIETMRKCAARVGKNGKEPSDEARDKGILKGVEAIKKAIAIAEGKRGPGARARGKDAEQALAGQDSPPPGDEATGDDAASKDDSGDKPERAPKPMHTATLDWTLNKGDVFESRDSKPYAKLLGDPDWFTADPSTGKLTALEDIKVVVKITRPKRDDDGKGEAGPAKKARAPKDTTAKGLQAIAESDEAADPLATPDAGAESSDGVPPVGDDLEDHAADL